MGTYEPLRSARRSPGLGPYGAPMSPGMNYINGLQSTTPGMGAMDAIGMSSPFSRPLIPPPFPGDPAGMYDAPQIEVNLGGTMQTAPDGYSLYSSAQGRNSGEMDPAAGVFGQQSPNPPNLYSSAQSRVTSPRFGILSSPPQAASREASDVGGGAGMNWLKSTQMFAAKKLSTDKG